MLRPGTRKLSGGEGGHLNCSGSLASSVPRRAASNGRFLDFWTPARRSRPNSQSRWSVSSALTPIASRAFTSPTARRATALSCAERRSNRVAGVVGVELEIGPTRPRRKELEYVPDFRIAAFLENVDRNPARPKLACGADQRVGFFLHRVADERQGPNLGVLRHVEDVRKDLADLGAAGEAPNLVHEDGETLPARHPGRFLALRPAIEHELHVELAERRCLPEHLGLKVAGDVPRWCSAPGGIETED
jgi:hypothetical protein